jgi:hypothetical protein
LCARAVLDCALAVAFSRERCSRPWWRTADALIYEGIATMPVRLLLQAAKPTGVFRLLSQTWLHSLYETERVSNTVILLLALLFVLIIFGLGFAIHLLWIVAVIFFFVWLIGFALGRGASAGRHRFYRW